MLSKYLDYIVEMSAIGEISTKNVNRFMKVLSKKLTTSLGSKIYYAADPTRYKNGSSNNVVYGRMCLLNDAKRAFRLNWKDRSGSSGVESIDFWIAPSGSPQFHVVTDDLNVVQLVNLIEQVLKKKQAGNYEVNGIVKETQKDSRHDDFDGDAQDSEYKESIFDYDDISDWMEARAAKKEKEEKEKKTKRGSKEKDKVKVKRTKVKEEKEKKSKEVSVKRTSKKDKTVNTTAKNKFDALFDEELNEKEAFDLLDVSLDMIKKGSKYSLIVSGAPGLGKCLHEDTYLPCKFIHFDVSKHDHPIYKIKTIFEIIQELEQHEFQVNEEFVPETPFLVRDENGTWQKAISMIIKMDSIYKLEIVDSFSNVIELKAGSQHKLINPEGKSCFVKDLNVGDKIKIVGGTAEIRECVTLGVVEQVYDITIESETHLYQDANGVIHHNTFGIKAALQGTGYELYTGSITGPSALYETLFKNNKPDKIIVFDDLDGLFGDEDSVNILKGALNSSKVREISYLSKLNVPLEIYDKVMSMKKAEDVFTAFPEEFMQKHRTEKKLQAVKVLKMKLEQLKDLGGADDDSAEGYAADPKSQRQAANSAARNKQRLKNQADKIFSNLIEKIGLPDRFDYVGRIIFITNKYLSEIPAPLLNRGGIVEINLDFDQMVKRIERIMPKLDFEDVTDSHKKKAMNFLKTIVAKSGKIPRIDFRGYELICDLVKTGAPEKVWTKWAAVSLMKAYGEISDETRKERKKRR